MLSKRSSIKLILLLMFLVVPAFVGGYFLRAFADSEGQELHLVEEALGALNQYSLVPLPDNQSIQRVMIHAAVGMLGDPFSVYIEPAEHELQSDDLAGEYGGIGALIAVSENGEVILTPYKDGPAYEAGIPSGTILISVDGEVIMPFPDLRDLTASLRGPEGSEVLLGVQFPGEPPSLFELTRDRIEIPSVITYLSPLDASVGVIKIIRFADSSPNEVRQGYQSLREADIHALVLDLRDNGGGLLESTVEVARFFLKSGTILTEERANGKVDPFRVERPGPASDLLLAVLVNGNTASAAEVLAASLQENGRAVLVGSQTFGKGTVQAVVELSDGSSLHITTARWLMPDNKTLNGIGLIPDFVLSDDIEQGPDPFLRKAQQVLLEESVEP